MVKQSVKIRGFLFIVSLSYCVEDEVSSRGSLSPVKILKDCRRSNGQQEYPETIPTKHL
jgi:hypothetical protein